MPFGEFIPPLFKWFTEMLNIPLGDFNRGTVGQPSFEWQGGSALHPTSATKTCLARNWARFRPAQAPTVLVNFSNIGWFGNTLAVDQHLQISRMRALELERPMVRATNTGATVIIDHRGVVTHRWSASAGVFCAAKCTGAGWGVGRRCHHALCLVGFALGAVAAVAACWPGCGGRLVGQAPPITPPYAGSGLMQVTLARGAQPAMRVYTRQ